MIGYVLRRLLLLLPTLVGIVAINFAVVQFAPGGPVEQAVAQIRHGPAARRWAVAAARRRVRVDTAARGGSTRR